MAEKKTKKAKGAAERSSNTAVTDFETAEAVDPLTGKESDQTEQDMNAPDKTGEEMPKCEADKADENPGEAEEDPGEGNEDSGEADANPGETDARAAGKKTGFGKKEKTDPRDAKIEELSDKLMRQMAEFDNYRKRTEKEKASMYEVGAREVIEKLLPVADNFERALQNADESDPFVDGVQKIYKQLTTSLEELGVTPIESVGCEFDPNLHNAVMHAEDEDSPPNTIVEEFQKGYKYKDTVIRYSMVKVAN